MDDQNIELIRTLGIVLAILVIIILAVMVYGKPFQLAPPIAG